LPSAITPDKPVPVFGDQDLASIERTCAGRTFAQRRDAAVIAVLLATGIFSRGHQLVAWCCVDESVSGILRRVFQGVADVADSSYCCSTG